jgi:hypothetical protein
LVTRALKLLAVVAVVVTSVGVAGLFGPSGLEASGHSATRSFDVDSVGPGGHVEVSVSVSGLGAFGGVAETLPEGFTYEPGSSSLPEAAVQVVGQTVTFAILGDAEDFTYTAIAPTTAEGVFSFAGVATDSNGDGQPVMGATDVTVGAAAVRSIGADVLSGAQVEVSISVSGLGDFGGVTETLPEGFVYLSSSLPDAAVSVDGQAVTFAIIGDSATFTYTVRAPDAAAEYSFTGIVTSSNDVDGAVGGGSSVTVEAEEMPLPEDETLKLPPTGDVTVPGWLIAVLGVMGALMLTAGATLAFRYGRSAAGRLT